MKIAMYDLEGHFLELLEGNTIKDIIELLPRGSNIKHGISIQKVIRGEKNYTGIYQFREVNSQPILQKIGSCIDLKNGVEKAVKKYFKGRYICTYKTLKEASDVNKVEFRNISRCLTIEKGTAGGFEWKYAN